MAVEDISLNVRVKFSHSRSNRSRDIRPAHLVLNDDEDDELCDLWQ